MYSQGHRTQCGKICTVERNLSYMFGHFIMSLLLFTQQFIGCAVSRRYINVCNCDMFSVVNVYLDHLKFCVVCIDGRRYVCSECLSARTVVKLCTLGVFALGVSLVC